MFAVALWTESQKRLVLVRDRMGIKPLYYYRSGEDVYFGSELKAILEHPEVPRHLDLDALDTYLSLNYVRGHPDADPRDPEGAAGASAGMAARETAQRSVVEADREPTADYPLEAAKEELDWLLRDSVREHLISDVPLGVWASGGLDSSTILHYAAAQTAGRLKTFSVSFQGRSFDESPYFREIARIYGTDHHEFDLNPDVELQSAIEDFAYYSDEPSADAGALPVWFLSRMSRQHVTVALSGEGADELFGGYLTYLADRLVRPFRDWCRRDCGALMRGALERYLPVSDDKISLEYKLKRWLEGSLLRSGRGALLLERHVLAASSGSRSVRGRTATACGGWWTSWGCAPDGRAAPVSGGGSELLSAGRYSVQDRPDEHGAFARGAAAVPGSPDCGFRGVAAAAVEDSRGDADARERPEHPC